MLSSAINTNIQFLMFFVFFVFSIIILMLSGNFEGSVNFWSSDFFGFVGGPRDLFGF